MIGEYIRGIRRTLPSSRSIMALTDSKAETKGGFLPPGIHSDLRPTGTEGTGATISDHPFGQLPTDGNADLWSGENHPYASLTPGGQANSEVVVPSGAPGSGSDAMLTGFSIGSDSGAGSALPQPVQEALNHGSPIRFSSAGENAQSGRQPDFSWALTESFSRILKLRQAQMAASTFKFRLKTLTTTKA